MGQIKNIKLHIVTDIKESDRTNKDFDGYADENEMSDMMPEMPAKPMTGCHPNQLPSRRMQKRQLSPTDESNPYKKKYFSYTRDRGGNKPFVAKPLDFSPRKKVARDKENKLAISNEPRYNNNQQAAKNLLNKAYKIKHNKTSSKCKSVSRPRREQKSRYDQDFIYEPPTKKRNKENDENEVGLLDN